ncbi:MAG: hypothetical protein HRF45_11295 [Fimbriimonadia bacterium]|jgi:hypothetical protein
MRAEEVPPGPKEPSLADRRALAGLVFAYVALALSLLAWATALVFLAAFRKDLDVGPWLVLGAGVGSLAGCVLSWMARQRVRDASYLHAALDFMSTFAWHVSWTSLILVMLCASQVYSAWQAAQEEIVT